MSNFSFKPSRQGFVDLRNEGFIQKQCLDTAQKVASLAGSQSGQSITCDVQPGRSRCHARASCTVGKTDVGSKKWYRKGVRASDARKALQDAAKSLGGKASRGGQKWKNS